MPQAIFITGGSGYIGSVLIELAISDGYAVKALSRSESSDTKLRNLGAVPIRGDLHSHDVLTKEAAAADAVIHIADALASDYSMAPEERLRINNAGVMALAAGLEGSGKAFILTSGSLLAAADPNNEETDESSPPWPNSPFGLGTEPVGLALKDKGIRVCSIRLAPWVYGRGGSGVGLFMGAAAKAGRVSYVGDGLVQTTTVHVEDAARLYLLAVQEGKAGEAYNATSETTVTHRQLAEAMASILNVTICSTTFEETEKRLGTFLATFLSIGNRASNAKAKKEFGWEPKAEKGILEEISIGSYVQVAQQLRESIASG